MFKRSVAVFLKIYAVYKPQYQSLTGPTFAFHYVAKTWYRNVGLCPQKIILLDVSNGAVNRILSVGDDPGCEHGYISVRARVLRVGAADAI
jgi:hypothetical protein